MTTKALNGPQGPKSIRSYDGPAGFGFGLAVKQGAADTACLAVTASGQKCIGINEFTDVVNTGKLGIVRGGETAAIAGAAVAADTECIVDANGMVIASTAQGDFVLGRTITSAAAANDEVIFVVDPYIR
jgi:hypothetical protein